MPFLLSTASPQPTQPTATSSPLPPRSATHPPPRRYVRAVALAAAARLDDAASDFLAALDAWAPHLDLPPDEFVTAVGRTLPPLIAAITNDPLPSVVVDPSSRTRCVLRADAHARVAAIFWRQNPAKKWRDALRHAAAAVAINPSGGYGALILVVILINRRYFEEALDPLALVEGRAPDDATVAVWRGVALDGAGRGREARKSFEKALKLRPGFVPALLGGGVVAFWDGAFEAAAATCGGVIEGGGAGVQIAFARALRGASLVMLGESKVRGGGP
jgi:tetratricopeptide (TPR) repeat protein